MDMITFFFSPPAVFFIPGTATNDYTLSSDPQKRKKICDGQNFNLRAFKQLCFVVHYSKLDR